MKVKSKSDKLINVYAIYWIADETYFLGEPPGYFGLLAYKSSDVEVVDNSLSTDFCFMQKGTFSGVIDRILFDDNLLDRLLELEPEAHRLFSERLQNRSKRKGLDV